MIKNMLSGVVVAVVVWLVTNVVLIPFFSNGTKSSLLFPSKNTTLGNKSLPSQHPLKGRPSDTAKNDMFSNPSAIFHTAPNAFGTEPMPRPSPPAEINLVHPSRYPTSQQNQRPSPSSAFGPSATRFSQTQGARQLPAAVNPTYPPLHSPEEYLNQR